MDFKKLSIAELDKFIQKTNLRELSNPELREIAKRKGFIRYSKLNKDELVKLIKTGSHAPPPKKERWAVIQSGLGVEPDKLFTEHDETSIYSVAKSTYPGGYLIRGINLGGMFNSSFIEPRTEQRTGRYYETDDSDDSDNDVQITYTEHIPGGWFVPAEEFPAFSTYIENLRALRTQQQPKSLFEIAAHVVNSKKQTVYLPPVIKAKLKHK